MKLRPIILIIITVILFIFIQKFTQQEIQVLEEQLPTGTIRTCNYTMGKSCGKCYCLETSEKGCEIIDISDIGDLAYAVNKVVKYKGTRDQNIIKSTKMCPHYIKLYKITIKH